MIKIAGIKSNDKINFKEFVDFFYKIDWSSITYTIHILGRNEISYKGSMAYIKIHEYERLLTLKLW